jgi:hypothetical protein
MLYRGLRNSLPKLRALGPYLLVEMFLPGGTLVALLLWLSQRYRRAGVGAVQGVATHAAAVPQAIAGKPHRDGEGCAVQAPPLSVQPA